MYKGRLIEKEDISNYREIIGVMLRLDRLGVEVFTLCIGKVMKYAMEKRKTENICIKALKPDGISILFMSDTVSPSKLKFLSPAQKRQIKISGFKYCL